MFRGPSGASRCALASVGTIALLTIGVEGAKAEDLKGIQSQIEAMQAQIKALQRQVEQAHFLMAALSRKNSTNGPVRAS